MKWTFHEGELGQRDVRNLLARHFAEMTAGSPPSACHVMPADALDDPAIRFITLRDCDGTLLGCGALRRLAADHAEIKSMRTAEGALGRGVGGAVLDHLTDVARAEGIRRLSLETASSPIFAAANRLYQREGFVRCGPFADYRANDFTAFYTREI